MTRTTSIQIEEAYFCSLSPEEINMSGSNLQKLAFDSRHDFLIDSAFAGIATKAVFINNNHALYGKGVCRKVSFTLIDTIAREEVMSVTRQIRISKDEASHAVYLKFEDSVIHFKSCHTYKLLVRDESADTALNEYAIHLYSEEHLGHPMTWYKIDTAGIRPYQEEHRIYRSVDTVCNKDMFVRFNLSQNFAQEVPAILPELEIRLHYPGGEGRVDTKFFEPSTLDFQLNLYFVEKYFYASDIIYPGVFYAELLCMQYPVAGFVFRVKGENKKGYWEGDSLLPMDEYSEDEATARYNRLFSQESEETTSATASDEKSDDEFDALLDRFIASETEAADQSENIDEPVEAEETYESAGTGTTGTDMDTSLTSSLDSLTGLHSVKDKLAVYERVVRFNRLRSDNGLSVMTTPLHAMFLGSPSTGKTTVANMMGIMLKKAGLLSRGHVVVRERATLLGQNYHSESEKTLAAIEEAQGGILFIDEAYQLYQPNDPRDPGKFVIETLLTSLSEKTDWMLILAGYPDEMKRMFDMNPGFKSRIPETNVYTFDDFTEAELMEIAERHIAQLEYTLSPEARISLNERLHGDYEHREKNFGNARHVINLIDTEILPAMAVRVIDSISLSVQDLTEIQAIDIPQRKQQTIQRSRIGFLH